MTEACIKADDSSQMTPKLKLPKLLSFIYLLLAQIIGPNKHLQFFTAILLVFKLYFGYVFFYFYFF